MTKAQENEAAWVKQVELWLKQDWFCKYCGFFLPGDPPVFQYGTMHEYTVCTHCETPLYMWIIIGKCNRKCLKQKDPKRSHYSFYMGIA